MRNLDNFAVCKFDFVVSVRDMIKVVKILSVQRISYFVLVHPMK